MTTWILCLRGILVCEFCFVLTVLLAPKEFQQQHEHFSFKKQNAVMQKNVVDSVQKRQNKKGPRPNYVVANAPNNRLIVHHSFVTNCKCPFCEKVRVYTDGGWFK